MKKRKKQIDRKTKKCELCGKRISSWCRDGMCYCCFMETNEPDVPLYLFYRVQGHSLDCSVAMEEGFVCGCEL